MKDRFLNYSAPIIIIIVIIITLTPKVVLLQWYPLLTVLAVNTTWYLSMLPLGRLAPQANFFKITV